MLNDPAKAVAPLISVADLTEVLIKHYDLHEGLYSLIIEFQIGKGPIAGPDQNTPLPGLVFAVSKVGLIPATADSATHVDAAMVNPAKKTAKKPKS